MSAVIVLGFDISHAIRTLSEYRPRRACVLLGSIDNRIDSRALIAFNSLNQVSLAMGISVERLDVEVPNFSDAVRIIERKLSELAESPPIFVDVGGGLRMLVIETLLAVLGFVRKSPSVDVRLLIYIEGTDRRLELPVKDLELMLIPSIDLTPLERDVLAVLSSEHPMELRDIHNALRAKGWDISKQHLVKILNRLIDYGYVKRISRGVYVKSLGLEEH